jgi:acyl carrier protein
VETNQRVRDFIVSNFYVPDAGALGNEQSLLDAGIIDSTGVLEIISFIEREFAVTVDDTEMVPENLDAIARIAGFIERKRARA